MHFNTLKTFSRQRRKGSGRPCPWGVLFDLLCASSSGVWYFTSLQCWLRGLRLITTGRGC
jgi:hypothetical protein